MLCRSSLFFSLTRVIRCAATATVTEQSRLGEVHDDTMKYGRFATAAMMPLATGAVNVVVSNDDGWVRMCYFHC